MLITVDVSILSSAFKLALIFREKIYQTLETALNKISNTYKQVCQKYSAARRFCQLSFLCLQVRLNTILAVFRGYIIKSRFKAANRFSVKQAGPGQDKLSLKTYHVKAN